MLQEFLAAGLDANASQSTGSSQITRPILHRISRDPVYDPTNRLSSITSAGIRPLHFTAYGLNGGHTAVAKLLLEYGADPDSKMENGRTPLHLCAMRNAYNVAQVLFDHGCQIDAVSMENNEKKTPLIKAVDNQHVRMVELLISVGADIDFQDIWGLTSLITAIFTDKPDIVKILIQHGCDINRQSKNGMSPVIASLRKKPECLQMLVDACCVLPSVSDEGLYIAESVDIFDNQNYKINQECYQVLQEWFKEVLCNPRSLRTLCRKVIRYAMGKQVQSKIQYLPLPLAVQKFLLLIEL